MENRPRKLNKFLVELAIIAFVMLGIFVWAMFTDTTYYELQNSWDALQVEERIATRGLVCAVVAIIVGLIIRAKRRR